MADVSSREVSDRLQTLFDSLDASIYEHFKAEPAQGERDYVFKLINDGDSYIVIGTGSLKNDEFKLDYNLVRAIIDDFNYEITHKRSSDPDFFETKSRSKDSIFDNDYVSKGYDT